MCGLFPKRGAMEPYRLYFVDDEGHITDVNVLDCTCDEEAIEAASGYSDGRAMELWQLDRRIRVFSSVLPGSLSRKPAPRQGH